MDTNVMIKLARAALDKGHEVNIFGYGEGVSIIKEGQDPRRFPNVGMDLGELIERGVNVVVCETCAYARGMKRGEEIKGAKIGSLTNDLSMMVLESDRMVTIGR